MKVNLTNVFNATLGFLTRDLSLVLSIKKTLSVFLLLLPTHNFAQETDENSALIVQEIQCIGNRATDCRFIKGRLYLDVGDKVDEEEISNAKLRLSTLGNFTSTSIYLRKGEARGKVIVVIEVKEASPYFTEFTADTIIGDSLASQRIAGRIIHQNLFGTGKIAEFEVLASKRFSSSEFTGDTYFTRLRYVDPHLFDSKKYFLTSGLSYFQNDISADNGEFLDEQTFRADLFLGRRIWDFSYMGVGYTHRYDRVRDFLLVNDRGVAETEDDFDDKESDFDDPARHRLSFTYGWNTEDDPYFPTQGSSAFITHTIVSLDNVNTHEVTDGVYRKTWQFANKHIWSFRFGTTPTSTELRDSLEPTFLTSVTYARPLKVFGINRGRWYVETGAASFSTEDGGRGGLRIGVRFESKHLGLVNLSIFGITE